MLWRTVHYWYDRLICEWAGNLIVDNIQEWKLGFASVGKCHGKLIATTDQTVVICRHHLRHGHDQKACHRNHIYRTCQYNVRANKKGNSPGRHNLIWWRRIHWKFHHGKPVRKILLVICAQRVTSIKAVGYCIRYSFYAVGRILAQPRRNWNKLHRPIGTCEWACVLNVATKWPLTLAARKVENHPIQRVLLQCNVLDPVFNTTSFHRLWRTHRNELCGLYDTMQTRINCYDHQPE